MGRRGPQPKNKPVELPSERLKRFDPPDGISARAVRAWDAYWRSPAAQFASPGDEAILLRWVSLIDKYERLMNLADENPMVLGSTGQSRTNPAYDVALRVATEIRQLEAVLNMGPANRTKLGAVAPTKKPTLDDFNREFEDDGDDEDDPRAL